MEHMTPMNGLLVLLISIFYSESVFAGKFQLFDIGCLLHLKHKYCIDATTQVLYRGLIDLPLFSSHTFLHTESYNSHSY